MKKYLIVFILTLVLVPFAQADTITLVADAWPPYNNASDDAQKGYIVDIAGEIFARYGHTVEYKLMPWKVAVEETRKGTYDGLIGADAEDGAGFVFPEEEAGSYQLTFFVKKGNPWRFTNTRSLERVKLGVAEGYGYNQWLHAYIEANKKDFNRIQSASGDYPLITNINKLMTGRIDATVVSASTMYYTAMKMGVLDQIHIAGTGGQGRNVFVVFSPAKQKSWDYAKQFDQGIAQMRVSGELARILKNYGLTDWK